MANESLKQQAAQAALQYIPDDVIVGVGTGSTVHFFIEALASIKHRIEGAVASSLDTQEKLKKLGIRVFDLNTISELPIYVDGADEANEHLQLIKGGGGALTREKILATVAKKFVCIIDESKFVDLLGKFPVAVEVIPMARGYVGRQIVKLGGNPSYREGYNTDNGNIILDIHNLKLIDPLTLEKTIKLIPGVVENGIFACRPADTLIIGSAKGIKVL